MKRVYNQIKTYSLHDGFMVDVTTTDTSYEAFIYHERYGVKNLMFGCPKEQQTYKYFLYLVEVNAPDYIEIYKDDYFES